MGRASAHGRHAQVRLLLQELVPRIAQKQNRLESSPVLRRFHRLVVRKERSNAQLRSRMPSGSTHQTNSRTTPRRLPLSVARDARSAGCSSGLHLQRARLQVRLLPRGHCPRVAQRIERENVSTPLAGVSWISGGGSGGRRRMPRGLHWAWSRKLARHERRRNDLVAALHVCQMTEGSEVHESPDAVGTTGRGFESRSGDTAPG
jgi:hypothetical protein